MQCQIIHVCLFVVVIQWCIDISRCSAIDGNKIENLQVINKCVAFICEVYCNIVFRFDITEEFLESHANNC